MTTMKAKLISLCAVLMLTGCSSVGEMTGLSEPKTSLSSIALISDSDANEMQAVMVDLLFIRDQTLVPQLPDNAVDWFNNRQRLQTRFGTELQVTSLQVPPDYNLAEIELPSGYDKAVRVILFANYLDKRGQLPVDITGYDDMQLQLRKDRVAVTEQPGWSLW